MSHVVGSRPAVRPSDVAFDDSDSSLGVVAGWVAAVCIPKCSLVVAVEASLQKQTLARTCAGLKG
eukprot:21642-Amphidinium_carterae.1